MSLPRAIAELPLPLRLAAVGAVALGAVGCAIGFVVGLDVYPPTAWAAALEIGLPSALLGAVLGLVAGSVKALLVRSHDPSNR